MSVTDVPLESVLGGATGAVARPPPPPAPPSGTSQTRSTRMGKSPKGFSPLHVGASVVTAADGCDDYTHQGGRRGLVNARL